MILPSNGTPLTGLCDLRHLFVTTALENGMDVKTLSTITGHVSAKTTLNVYTHVTDAMRQTAAAKSTPAVSTPAPRPNVRQSWPI